MLYFECASDMGGGCALPSSGDADLPSGLSYATAARCGLETRSVVAEEPLGTGPSDPPVRGPSAGAGPSAFAHPCARLVHYVVEDEGTLAVSTKPRRRSLFRRV